MNAISHRDRRAFGHQIEPMPADTVADDPAWQPTLHRLMASVGDINSRQINRVEYVIQVASAIRQRREAQR